MATHLSGTTLTSSRRTKADLPSTPASSFRRAYTPAIPVGGPAMSSNTGWVTTDSKEPA